MHDFYYFLYLGRLFMNSFEDNYTGQPAQFYFFFYLSTTMLTSAFNVSIDPLVLWFQCVVLVFVSPPPAFR